MHVRRRLLQRLQQPVRHLVVHRVHALQHEHAPPRLERRPVGRVHHRALHVVHPHHVRAARAHPGQIGMRPVHHARAHGVRIIGPLGQQLRRERPRHRPLPGPGGPVEQIRVRGLPRGQRSRQHHPRLRVVLRPCERDRHPRAASTAARTSAWTSSGERVASMRRQRSGIGLDQLLVRRADRLLQLAPLVLEAVALPRARGRVIGRQIQEERQVGLQARGWRTEFTRSTSSMPSPRAPPW